MPAIGPGANTVLLAQGHSDGPREMDKPANAPPAYDSERLLTAYCIAARQSTRTPISGVSARLAVVATRLRRSTRSACGRPLGGLMTFAVSMTLLVLSS